MIIETAAYSSIGKRKNNEDSFIVEKGDKFVLAVVADGVGGYDGGEVASQAAVQSLTASLDGKKFDIETLEDAVVIANQAVLGAGSGTAKTTVAILWCSENEAAAVNLGDSRIYQFRDGSIIFQSKDHSVPQLDVDAGIITVDEIRLHKSRNKITRCLGLTGPVKMNSKKLDVRPGDRFLLCSDGFWEPVLEKDMLRTAAECPGAEEWLSRMRRIAREKESDNHTAIAIVVPHTADPA